MTDDIADQINSIDFDSIAAGNESIRAAFKILLNIIERQADEIKQLRDENQKLKDDINRLKGEQGKPDIRPQTKTGNVSSEDERKRKKQKGKRPKRPPLKIDRSERCEVEKSTLPTDAIYKGTEKIVIQDVVIKTDNVEFHREVFYSPSEGKSYRAHLPPGYEGQFGPGVKSLVMVLYHDANVSQPAICRLLNSCGLDISAAKISRILADNDSIFHQEKADIIEAGLQSTNHHHIDDTGARVNGKNHYVHVLCNPYYTAYFTRPKKDRLTVIDILSPGGMQYLLNTKSIELMRKFGLAQKHLSQLELKVASQIYTQQDMDLILKSIFPNSCKQRTKKIILEACAIIGYRNRPDAIDILVCDDAPQFKNITEFLELCWVHEGRHYKKLRPWLIPHRRLVAEFLTDFWNYYHKLLEYKKSPNPESAQVLSEEFDELTSRITGYDILDERIKKTSQKKAQLLLVLDHPQIKVHNNPAELAARAQARKRDVSLQTKNEKGTQAKDAGMTVLQTAKKLGVNVIDYTKDRLGKIFSMKSLADIIRDRTTQAAFG
jgi:hypothetical protein